MNGDFLATARHQLAEIMAEGRRRQREKDDRAAAAREAIARELGYPSFGYMLSIGLVRAVTQAQNRPPPAQAAE
jgi:hypothetical protein